MGKHNELVSDFNDLLGRHKAALTDFEALTAKQNELVSDFNDLLDRHKTALTDLEALTARIEKLERCLRGAGDLFEAQTCR